MARWGFRAVNRATGSVQIDGLYANLALISKATATTGAIVGPGPELEGAQYSQVVLPTITSAIMPVLALRCAVPATVFRVSRPSADQWVFTLIASGASRSIECFVFGEPPPLGPGWGMRLKQGSKVIFDSRHLYSRPVDSVSGTFDGVNAPSKTLPAGKTCAIVSANTTRRFVQIAQEIAGLQNVTWNNWILAPYINGGALNSGIITTRNGGTSYPLDPVRPSFDIFAAAYRWVVLDVTGY